ncbi:MAG: ABC transporter substrate-binding protein [Bilophila sp.]
MLFGGVAFAALSPSASLQGTVDGILLILKEPDYRNPALRPPLRAQIERQIHEVFDFGEFSARTVGRNWPSFSVAQKKRFDEAFADLLLVTYLDKVQGYNGEKIVYTGETLSNKGDRAEVQTVVTLSDGKAVPVAYRMMDKAGRWVVYDVLIENVSLIKNYRSQFQDVLAKGTPDQLIERVALRAKELRAQSTAN